MWKIKHKHMLPKRWSYWIHITTWFVLLFHFKNFSFHFIKATFHTLLYPSPSFNQNQAQREAMNYVISGRLRSQSRKLLYCNVSIHVQICPTYSILLSCYKKKNAWKQTSMQVATPSWIILQWHNLIRNAMNQKGEDNIPT